MRFLVTGAGGPAGFALARQLAARGHEVIGTDMRPTRSDSLIASEVVPPASDSALLDELRRLAERYSVDALLPTVQDELLIVAEAASRWFPTPVVIADEDAVSAAHDKYLTMLRLYAAGVPVPRFSLPGRFATTQEALGWFGTSVVVKPRISRGSRGVRIVHHAEDLEWSSIDDSHIVQEYAPGTEYAPMVHVSSLDASIRAGVVEKAEPAGCWDTTKGLRALAIGQAEDIERLAIDTALCMGLTGPVDIDVRRRADGIAVVLEVNARFGANSEYAPQILDGVLADLTRYLSLPGLSGAVR